MKNSKSNHHDVVTVDFQPYVNLIEFEQSLKESYWKSTRKKIKQVEFNFTDVLWCDIFALSQISLWILELKAKEKKILFDGPTSERVKGFLIDYEFTNFLIGNRVETDLVVNKKPYSPVLSPMYPLSFRSKKGFKDLISEVTDPKRLSIILNEIKDTEIVKKNAIHTIILKELADNVFIHAKVDSANFIMTKLSDRKQGNLITTGMSFINYLSDLEKPFFKKLRGEACIVLIIGDKGDGIYKALVNAYVDDPIIQKNDKKKEPIESEVIKYAFLKHSTSRSDEERKKQFREAVAGDILNLPLPTGLYKVLNTVKQYSGVLCVRSGKSVVSYDFFSSVDPDIPIIRTEIKQFKTLTRFRGTQFRLYFPLEPRSRAAALSIPELEIFPEKHAVIKSEFISLNDYFSDDFELDDEANVSLLEAVSDKIQSFHVKSENINAGVIMDACGFRGIQSKNICHFLLATLMVNQSELNCNVIFDLDSNKIKELKEDFEDIKDQSIKPIVAFDTSFRKYLIGTSVENDEVFTAIVKKGSGFNGKEITFIENNRHLFSFDEQTMSLKYSKKFVLSYVSGQIRKRVEKAINNPKWGIYHKDVKVLIPDKYYSKGFIEIYNIFSHPGLLSDINKWFDLLINQTYPDVILTIGENCRFLIRSLVKDAIARDDKFIPRLYHVPTPLRYSNVIELNSKIGDEEKVLIITDVIGSGKTLKDMLNLMPNKNVTKIATIANTNQDHFGSIEARYKKCALEAIINTPLKFHDALPRTWNYNEVLRVDRKTNRLIENIAETQGPLWIKLNKEVVSLDGEKVEVTTNNFLKKVVGRSRSCFNDHFEAPNKHLTYLFNIPRLLRDYAEKISSIIYEYTAEQLRRITKESKDPEEILSVTHIIYPSFNPGLDEIATKIAGKFGKSKLVEVGNDEVMTGFTTEDSYKNSAVIIIDDAVVSGETITRLIDLCARRNASHAFVYAIVKRGNDYEGRKFESLKKYGETTIQARYLVDAEIPVFDRAQCPICNHLDELANVVKTIEYVDNIDPFMNFIRKQIRRNRSKNVQTIIAEDGILKDSVLGNIEDLVGDSPEVQSYSNVFLRWKLELARTDPAIRKELTEKVASYKVDSEQALSLIRVIAYEKWYFLKNKGVRDSIFYKSFRKAMREACRYFINKADTLSAEDILAVGAILIEFAERDFTNTLTNILLNCGAEHDKFFAALMLCFFCSEFNETPLRASKLLEKALIAEADEERRAILNGLLYYLKNEGKELKKTKHQRLHRYRELRINVHTLYHRIEALDYHISATEIDVEGIKDSWGFLNGEFFNYQRALEGFLSGYVSDKTYWDLREGVVKLGLSLNEISRVIQQDNFEKDDMRRVALYLKRIDELISEKDKEYSIANVLDRFKTDISKICYEVLTQERNALNEAGVEADYTVPRKIRDAFGEEFYIVPIFKNLVENARKHSGGSRILIKILVNEEDEVLDILFLDNGRLPRIYELGEGLQIVNLNASLSGGEFRLDNFTNRNSYFEIVAGEYGSKTFRTVAHLRLPHIRPTYVQSHL